MPKKMDPGLPALTPLEQVMDAGDTSLLDVLDHVLNKGVMATGDLTLGVAGIDLVYVRLSALLCAADRVLARPPGPSARRRHGQPRRRSGSRGPAQRHSR